MNSQVKPVLYDSSMIPNGIFRNSFEDIRASLLICVKWMLHVETHFGTDGTRLL